MYIRDEERRDAKHIALILYTAFKDHPAHPPGAEPIEHCIVEALRNPGALSVSLVAEEGGETVGHIALSPATVGSDTTGWYLLGPVGVDPVLQGRGIGSALINEGLRRLRTRKAAGVVLVGDPGFYARFGFHSVPGLTYPDVPDKYVLACPFGDDPVGAITAHDAFGVGE